jgi:GntR family transcriptional regulator, transcriptional repressor for pyruvate dehydrogenase complex
MTHFTPIAKQNIKELALTQLKRYIASGVVKHGGRLPSERELAEKLGVARSSVREALKVLEAVGVIESRVGDGTYLASQTGASFGRSIGLSLAVWGGTLVEIMDARQAFEVSSARLAAERATPDDILALQREVDVMTRTGSQDPRAYLAADMNFHRLVGCAGHNPIVREVVTNLIGLLEQVLSELKQLPLYTTTEIDATHLKVLKAIVAHKPEQAAQAMRDHIHESSEMWQALVSVGGATRSNITPTKSGK